MDFKLLIKEICKEENIDYKLLSKEWIIALTKGNITKYIVGYNFPLNDHSIGSIIDDKYAFYELCKMFNLPIIEHKILFNYNTLYGKDTLKLIDNYFESFNRNVVIKPNNGSRGIGVKHITNKEDLLNNIDKLFVDNFSISICPFYNIDSEYRVVVLDREVKLVFEKIKPIVYGNGIHTIKELLIKLNYDYFKDKELNKEYDIILDKGNIFEYDWRFNLSNGATAKIVNDKLLLKRLSDLALLVTDKINAKFVTVDIIKSNNNYYLIELNSGVCINKVCNFIDKNIAKDIYSQAIHKMFD